MKIIDSLEKLGLSNVFTPHEIQSITLNLVKKDEYLYIADSTIKDLYILLSGELKVFSTSSQGKVYIVAFIQELEMVGEFELLDMRTSCLCNIAASKESLLLKIPFSLAKEKINNNFTFLSFISRKIAEKSFRNSIKELNVNLDTSRENILFLLRSNKNKKFLAEEIGEYLGLTGRHVRRILKQMIQEGILLKKNNHFYLKSD